jgi:hypothetical protein
MFRHRYLSREELVSVLDDMKRHVEAGDSMEGSIEYLFPWSTEIGDPETDPPDGFRVMASYRVGNLRGQGGLRMVNERIPSGSESEQGRTT